VKAESVIIDIRHQIPWQKRYISNTGTLMLWGFWILLWQPIAISVGLIEVRQHKLVEQLMNAFFNVVENGFTTICICAVLLWLWSRFMPAETVKQCEVKSMKEYSEHFKIDMQTIHQARQKKIVTVHHDASGQIRRIE
jgi:poly-beta-1,6-N-acetyl-D-glucosamine biosynthesis protein PgaD